MEFFKQLEKHLASFDFTMTVKTKGDKITVGIFPSHSNKDVNDKLKPMSITGTAEELDAELFDIIGKPLQAAVGIVANIQDLETDLKKLEEQKKGKLAAASEKGKTDKKKPDTKKPAKEKPEADDEEEEEKAEEAYSDQPEEPAQKQETLSFD